MPETKTRLIPRLEAADMLGGVSIATLARLERRGRLHPIRLTRGSGKVFYREDDIARLMVEDQEDQESRPKVERAVMRKKGRS